METTTEQEHWFRNHYQCPSCSYCWSDVWSATCDDDCPNCGQRHISPAESDDLVPRNKMLRSPSETEKVIQVVIFRQGGERTCAIVRALVAKNFGDDWDHPQRDTEILQGAIQLAVTEWFGKTGRGKQVIEADNNFDFNVGDLADEIGSDYSGEPGVRFDEGELCWFLQQQGIIGLEIKTYVSNDAEHFWDFDDKLYDEMEIGWGNDDGHAGDFDVAQEQCPYCNSGNIGSEGPPESGRLLVSCFDCSKQWMEPASDESKPN